MKLRTKTTLFFGIFFIAITAAIIFYVEYVVTDSFKRQTTNNFRIIAEQSEGTYISFLESMKTRAIDWTSDVNIQRLSKEIIESKEGTSERKKLADELGQYIRDKKMIYDKSVVVTDLLDVNGFVIASTDQKKIGKNEKNEEIARRSNKFSKAINSKFGEAFFGGIVLGEEEHPRPLIAAAVRIFTFVGGLEPKPLDAVLLLHFDNMEQFSTALGVGNNKEKDRLTTRALLDSYKTSDIYLVNNEHFLVTHSRFVKDSKERKYIDTFPVSECLEKGKEVSQEYNNFEGIQVLGSSMCFFEDGITFIVEVHKNEVYSSLSALILYTIIGATVILLTGIIASFFFIRRPLKNIQRIVDVANKVESGDLNARVKLEEKDEIGALAKAFDLMIQSVGEQRDLEIAKNEAEIREKILEKNVKEHQKQEKELKEAKDETQKLLEESRKTGERLKVESNRLQTVLESIWDGIILIDTNYKIMLVNPKAVDFFAIPKEDIIGKDLREIMILFKEDKEFNSDEWPTKKMFADKMVVTTTIEDDLSLMTSHRKVPLSIELYVSPLEGGIAGGVIVISDVTADRELDEAKSGFISVASHQLRTPLTSIRWYSEMLLSGDVGPLNDEQKDFMTEVHSGTERLYQTVDLLLGISRVENGTMKTEKENIDISKFTEGITKELASQVDAKKIKLTVSVPDGDTIIVSLDTIMLRQVILNLFSNAIRYTKLKDGIIEISWKKSDYGKEVVYSVRDNGIGIPEGVRSHIFSKFFRAENARTAVPDGSGLGLALVKELAESWGGRVWFDTEEGRGSTFYFTIPI